MADVGGVLVSGAKPPSTCNYTSNKISQGNGGKNLHPVHQTSVGSRSPKKGRITQDCQNLTVLHAYEIDRKNARNAEHGVSSAKPFNACNYARNVPKMGASKS